MSNALHKCVADAEQFLLSHGVADAAFEAKEIVLFAAKIDRKTYSLFVEQSIGDDAQEFIYTLLQQRANGMPLQYILGEWDFYGHTFYVEKDVLIPRPETEELTDIAICHIRKSGAQIVYDVCGGTGCIGISVALACPQVQVYIFELYTQPLHCIARNIEKLGVQNVHIVECDVLMDVDAAIPKADVIVSNPPYIPRAELTALQAEVQHEPMTALDGGEDGLIFYRALSVQWFEKLNANGFMFLECAENQTDSILSVFQNNCSQIAESFSDKDFYGLDRFVYIHKK